MGGLSFGGVNIDFEDILWMLKSIKEFFRREKSIPVGQFVKKVKKEMKRKFGFEPSENDTMELLDEWKSKGLIELMTSKHGKTYVIIGNVDSLV